jgi:hypothetical protein
MAMASFSLFPDDPPGVDVIDRAFFRDTVEGKEYTVYLIIYNQGNQGTLDIRSGTMSSGGYLWKNVCSWQPANFEFGPILFDPLSVISLQQSGASLIITWVDKLSSSYVEGLASLYLDYNLQTEGYEEYWVD